MNYLPLNIFFRFDYQSSFGCKAKGNYINLRISEETNSQRYINLNMVSDYCRLYFCMLDTCVINSANQCI